MMAKSLAAGAMMHPQGSRSRNRRRRHEAAGALPSLLELN